MMCARCHQAIDGDVYPVWFVGSDEPVMMHGWCVAMETDKPLVVDPPITREMRDGIRQRFYALLAERHPDHLWLKQEKGSAGR